MGNTFDNEIISADALKNIEVKTMDEKRLRNLINKIESTLISSPSTSEFLRLLALKQFFEDELIKRS